MNPDERIRMINCNAHKNDTHRVQNSDAGVGFGTLIGDRDYFAQQIENWFDYHICVSCFLIETKFIFKLLQ